MSENHITGNKGKNIDQEKEDSKEMYSEAHEFKRDIKEENLIEDLSNKINFTDEQKSALNKVFSKGEYTNGNAAALLNDLNIENKEVYNQLTKMNNDIWKESGKSAKTFSNLDLIKVKIESLLKNNELKKTDNSNEFDGMDDKEFFDKYRNIIPSMGRYGTPETQKQNIESEIDFQENMKNKGSSGYSKFKHNVLNEALKRLSGENKTEQKKEPRPKKEVSVQVKMKRKEQQKKEKEKYDYNKRMNDFYVNTGLDGGPEAVLYRQAVEKEENKQPNLRAGSRDDSIFEENDDVQFWRSGNYIDGKITQVKESYDGTVSLQVESNGNKYWVETENIIKHPASDSEKGN